MPCDLSRARTSFYENGKLVELKSLQRRQKTVLAFHESAHEVTLKQFNIITSKFELSGSATAINVELGVF